MTDENYAPITHNGDNTHSNTNMGDFDDTHPFMDGVSSINSIYFWSHLSKEAPATWVSDLESGPIHVAVNEDFTIAGVLMYPGDVKRWTGDGWVLYNNIIQNLMEGLVEDFDPPYVEGMDPDDGEVDVPVDSAIVFHCVDEISRVEIDTIDFSVQDTSLRGDRMVSSGAALSIHPSPTRTLPGELDIDDTDEQDIICTWTGYDDFYEGEIITCTVAAGLADSRDNEMEEDFVWSFDTGPGAVTTTTWGAIKAGI